VRLLLSAGADPGAEDNMSNSPLHVAAQLNQSMDITGMLLEAGAKAYQRNSRGERPIDLAEEKGCAACVDMLRESLNKIRKSRKTGWKCPDCGVSITRPSTQKTEWYLGLEMWEHLRFTCGNCGRVTPATTLDGEN
jgi:ankyrin repeat protein